jgi:hypothetical protein
MKEPKLTLALAERGDQPILLMSRNDSEQFNRIAWGLGQLAKLGYMGACERIGNAALMMLHPAHAQAFASYPALVPPESPVQEPIDVLHYLLQLSIRERTRRYVALIDMLVAHHAKELSDYSFPQQWPILRERLLHHPD